MDWPSISLLFSGLFPTKQIVSVSTSSYNLFWTIADPKTNTHHKSSNSCGSFLHLCKMQKWHWAWSEIPWRIRKAGRWTPSIFPQNWYPHCYEPKWRSPWKRTQKPQGRRFRHRKWVRQRTSCLSTRMGDVGWPAAEENESAMFILRQAPTHVPVELDILLWPE